ncbi:MAG: hypothetical protein JXR69_07670 [Candidatus Delongbacteria bacterium]|nr:hypothetical protein [Candidatus Delongbacteria bacterium]
MKTREEIVEIVELLARNEQALADLYTSYSEKFPDFKLWTFLRKEEEDHFHLVISIKDNVEDGSVDFSDMHFSVKTITMAIEQVLNELKIVENGGRTLGKAIKFALKLESSMLEKNFLNYFSSDDPELEKVLVQLRTDTKSHQNILEKALDEYLKEKEYNSFENIVKRINNE